VGDKILSILLLWKILQNRKQYSNLKSCHSSYERQTCQLSYSSEFQKIPKSKWF